MSTLESYLIHNLPRHISQDQAWIYREGLKAMEKAGIADMEIVHHIDVLCADLAEPEDFTVSPF